MLKAIVMSMVLGTTGAVRMEVKPPHGKPGVICTLPAVECSDPEEQQQAECTALALQGHQVVAIWGDACK